MGVLQEGDGGLYVSLHNFMGVGRQWLELHHRKTGDRLFLHIKKKELPKVFNLNINDTRKSKEFTAHRRPNQMEKNRRGKNQLVLQ